MLRAAPGLFGRVASDPTVSRTIDGLATDVTAALAASDAALRVLAPLRAATRLDRTQPLSHISFV